ncbi:MAG: hypothetical protein ACRELB_11545, partial [Polyangiaceae bacterium]
MDPVARAEAFLAAGAPPDADSLSELLEVRRALSLVYHALAEDPSRADGAAALLAELRADYERLTRQVGVEVASRAERASARAAVPVASAAAETPPAEAPPEPAPPASRPEALPQAKPPASEDAVRAWTATHRVGERASSPRPSSLLVLHGLLDRVGRPGAVAPAEELDRLEEGACEEALGDLRQLPNDVQRSYLRMVTARINAVRLGAAGELFVRERARRMLDAIRDYTREYRPGAVHGLARDHEPKRGSWAADGAALWRELGGEEEGESTAAPSARPSATGSRRARTSPEDAGGASDATDAADASDLRTPEPTWPFWDAVRASTVLMVGGSPREAARERIEKTFQMRELVWIADEPRKAQSAEARIGAGGFGLVLVLLRFVSHPTSEKLAAACEGRGVPYAAVEHGYGVRAIQQGIERFL